MLSLSRKCIKNVNILVTTQIYLRKNKYFLRVRLDTAYFVKN